MILTYPFSNNIAGEGLQAFHLEDGSYSANTDRLVISLVFKSWSNEPKQEDSSMAPSAAQEN